MKTQFKNTLVIIFLLASVGLVAQQKQAIDTMSFQLGFITPLGTNGTHSWNTVNKVSLNFIGEYSGGIYGFGASGFCTVLKGGLLGAQLSGFFNANLAQGKGAQLAGYVNFNYGNFEGAQLAGFVNTTVGNFEGAQVSGFANIATMQTRGAQVSCGVNVLTDSITGFQGAGFGNFSMGNSAGQVCGFLNVNIGDLSGIQLTGFVNVNTGAIKGAQLAFANQTKQLNGVQLGVFNYVDSVVTGTPIGLLSIVKNGYRTFELSTSETLYGITTFKTGTRYFYNIFSAGFAFRSNTSLWGFGYGIGTQWKASEKVNLAFEAQSFQINENGKVLEYLNLWNKICILSSVQVKPNFEIFGGPTFNAVVSETTDNSGYPVHSIIAPYSTFNKVYQNGISLQLYPGISVGVRF